MTSGSSTLAITLSLPPQRAHWSMSMDLRNVGYPLDDAGTHSVMFYGRSYESDAHELFSKEAYNDVVLELGGRHDFPYTFNLIGAKYRWQINEETYLKAGYELATVDFRDSFPNDHIFNLNYTEYPKFNAAFRTVLNDMVSIEAEAFYQAPTLKNSEVDAQLCRIPQSVLNPATRRPFTLAAEFEAFARANGIPAGCVTNPETSPKADRTSRDGFYFDDRGQLYGTLQNPFPIGAPMGFVIQTVASFGTGIPTKGFGEGTQFLAGYSVLFDGLLEIGKAVIDRGQDGYLWVHNVTGIVVSEWL